MCGCDAVLRAFFEFRDAAFENVVLILRGVWLVQQLVPEPFICQCYIDHPTLSKVSSALALGGSRSAGSPHILPCSRALAFSTI